MASQISEISRASAVSQRIIDEVTKKSDTRILKLEGKIDQETIHSAWTAFGLYLSKNIQMGRAVVIPKFGTIQFGAPEVNLTGVTNPDQRDVRLRKPVFIINKEFVKGKTINAGIYSGGQVRPYSQKGVISGIGEVKINYTEISIYAGVEKDTAKIAVERIIKQMSEDCKNGKSVEMEIPNLGRFLIKGNTAAMEFDEFVVNSALDMTNKHIKQQRLKGVVTNGETQLTRENLDKLVSLQNQSEYMTNEDEKLLRIDEGAQTWLKDNLNIDLGTLKAQNRPKSSISRIKPNTQHFSTGFGLGGTYQRDEENKSTISKAKTTMQRPTTAVNKKSNIFSNQANALESGRKKIKMWIRAKSLLAEDAFVELGNYALGPIASFETKLTLDQLKSGIQKSIGLTLNDAEVEAVFEVLDSAKDGTINLDKWKTEFTDDRSYLNYIRDVVAKYNLQTDDVLRRMDLNRESIPLNVNGLKEALKNLDPSLNDYKAGKLSREILKDTDTINMGQLIEVLGCPPDDAHESSDFYHTQLVRIKKIVKDVSILQKQFERYDERNEGWISTSVFKTALFNLNLGFSKSELNRFTRYVDKDSNLMIDYIKFVKLVEDTKTEEELNFLTTHPDFMKIENFHIIKNKVTSYLQENGISPAQLVRKLFEKKNPDLAQSHQIKKISTSEFSDFIFKLCKDSLIKRKVCREFADKIDIDHDNQIDGNDVATFLNRYGYIDKAEKKATMSHFSNTMTNAELYPKQPLSEEKVEAILRDLRQSLNQKKISYYDFLKKIDINDVGFITINDFSQGLDKVVKLSQPAKDGLFAYLDKLKIGMVDHSDVLKLLKRTVIDKVIDVTEDNFDWHYGIIAKIKQWVKEKNLNVDDAFRIADADFDGFISKKDLTYFVKDVLKVLAEDVTSPRIDRLFKLMDLFKRGRIQLSDFKRVIFDDMETANNATISGGKTLFGRSTFDWRVHAKQQLGLILSKNFQSTKESFESIAHHNVKMIFKQFSSWVDKTNALAGFDLTNRLLQQLFADLDPHKKGYLTELDWINAFENYNFHEQMFAEVQESLNANYSDINSCLDFFMSHEKEFQQMKREITASGFASSIQSLIPKRFEKKDIQYLWKKCAGNNETVSASRFRQLFDNGKFTGAKYVDAAKVNKEMAQEKVAKKLTYTAQRASRGVYNNSKNISKEEFQEKVFEKIRQVLHASSISVEKFYKQMDTDGSGEVSNLEFINAIRGLNLGLNLKEIEELLLYVDSNQDGKVSFKEFVTKFAPRDSENRLFERSKNKLKKIKDNIYAYMLSPKDAFLTFNEDRTGKLTYSQFNKLIVKLHQLSREDVPAFPIIKDLFDFIDIRRDGIIDMTEWMQSFRLIESEGISIDTGNSRPGTSVNKTRGVNVNSLNKTFYPNIQNGGKNGHSMKERPKTAINVSAWECSKEYEQIMKIVGKNRKILVNTFDDLKKQGVQINKKKIKEVISRLLENNGLSVTEEQWPYLLKFSEKDGDVDYKFLLDVFRERSYLLTSHPKISLVSFT